VELNRYKELDRIKSNFILQVTHELIHKTNRRTENLLQIIDEMIDYAYMKSEEEVGYTKTALNVREIIDYQLDIHSSQAIQKNIELAAECPGQLLLFSNRDLLNIILSNLINNAIKYSPGSTTITVRVDAGLATAGPAAAAEVHLVVADQGYGIEPEELEKIFEEFYRTRKARELERDGTGLGLSIVQRAVESLGGRLTVYSELDKGTTFHIFIPAGGENGKDSNHR